MSSRKKALSQALYIALIFFGGCFIYSGLGAILGTLRTDEIYFLTTATWLLDGHRPAFDYNGSFYVLFRYLLNSYFLASGQSYASLWGIRVINLILSIVQCIFICAIWRQALTKWTSSSRPLSIFIATVYFVMIASFRGYEIRPEIIPITLFVFGVYVSMRLASLDGNHGKHWVLIAASLLGLVLAGSISIRMAIPSFIFFNLIAIQAFQKKTGIHWGIPSVVIGVPIMAAIVINVVWINFYNLYFIGTSERAFHPHFDWFLKLTIGESSLLFLAIKIGLMVFWFAALVIGCRRANFYHFVRRHPTFLALLLSLTSFYLFLETIDFRPFEYVRAIEWSFLVCIAPFALMAIAPKTISFQCQKIVSTSIVIIGLTLGCLSAQNIFITRNTTQAISALLSSKNINELQVMSDGELIHHLITGSLLEQLWSRQVYCRRHPTGQAVVAYWPTHPICMKDAGSLAYSGWDGKMPFRLLDLDALYYINLAPEDKDQSSLLTSYFHLTDSVWHKK